MDTRFLESLLAVTEHGSIAEAARQQSLTPAAIGQRIQSLESELGTPLLQRVGQRARPTSACLRILPQIRDIVTRAARLSVLLNPGEVTGTLRLGAISTVLTDYIPTVLTGLAEAHPKLRLSIQPGSSRDLFEAVKSGGINAAIIVAPPFQKPKSLYFRDLKKEPLVVIAKKALALKREALSGVPYIRYDADAWGGRIAERFRRAQGLLGDPFCDLDSLESIAALVGNGVGFSLVPRWEGLNRFSDGLWISSPLGSAYTRNIVLASWRRPPEDPMIAAIENASTTAIRQTA